MTPPAIPFSEGVSLPSEDYDLAEPLAEALQAVEDCASTANPGCESDTQKSIVKGVSILVDSLPGLVRALDKVAKLHPFIGTAVDAFRVVVELDLKRRDNDKKISVLFVEMRDTMATLLQLRGIKDEESVGPDGQTIKARMQELVKRTAEDIKKCANTCDTYAKKRLLVKVIKGSAWEGTLKGFITLFADRRKAFTFALSIHVGIGVDCANRKLKEIDAKLDTVLDFFSKVVAPDQLELAALVRKKGGPTAVMGDNDTLKELLKFLPATTVDQAKHGTGSGRDGGERSTLHGPGPDGDELAVVKQELFHSPELAIKKNLELFERKFKMQQRERAEEIRRVVHHAGDRLIEAVTSGPHDRIIDPHIHETWKEMRWPGHVKARHFVLALRDYYHQQIESKRKGTCGDLTTASRVADEDEWALQWININTLQAITKSFDDDASGFITVAEVNNFTASRPKEWSLPHWLAYSAIGWQMTMTKYRDMIDNICAKMFAIRPQVHPKNRHAVDWYLQTVWKKITTVTASFDPTYQDESLEKRFKSFVEAEEERLREGLELVKYHIDATDTLWLVTGPGCIENHLFPLLWLLLRRDFEIVRQCRNTVIHQDALWNSANTLVTVFKAVTERHNDLEVLFRQQKMDAGQQFKVFANEIFDYWHDSEEFWSLNNLRTLEFLEADYDDSKEDQSVNVNTFPSYPSLADDLYPPRVEDPITEIDTAADEAVRLILGRWNGHIVFPGDTTSNMMTFCLHASVNHATYEASAVMASGTYFNILGTYTTRDNDTEYTFTQTCAARFQTRYFTGTLGDGGATLCGKWGHRKDDQPYMFIFKRISPELLVDRPHPKEFSENGVKALWKYALTTAHNQVRRRLFSWSYLKQRRDVRKGSEPLLKLAADGVLTCKDFKRLSALHRLATFDDVRCFYVLQDYNERAIPTHLGIACDHCDSPIYGTRVVCMQCGSRSTFDFCDKPACVGCTIENRDDTSSPHLPTHDFVKIRAPIVQYREIGKVLRNATASLERAKALLEKGPIDSEQKQGEEMEKSVGYHEEFVGGSRRPDDKAPTSSQEKTVTRTPGKPDTMRPSDMGSANEVATPTCLKCKAPVSQPCFYCIDCPNSNAFVCWECDEREAGFSLGEHHLATHNLVRCMKVPKDEEVGSGDDRTEERLDSLENKLEGLMCQMEKLTSGMKGLTSQMERIEKLLQFPPTPRCSPPPSNN